MTDKTAEKNAAASRDAAAKQTAEAVEANSNLTVPSGSALAAAQAEGVKEAVKEAAKDTYQFLTDGNLPGAPPARQFTGMDDIMQFEPLLGLGLAEFEDKVSNVSEEGVPEEKVAGLLELERSGQNRTPYVQALCKRLGVKSPYEVTNAGPGYTNDVTALTPL